MDSMLKGEATAVATTVATPALSSVWVCLAPLRGETETQANYHYHNLPDHFAEVETETHSILKREATAVATPALSSVWVCAEVETETVSILKGEATAVASLATTAAMTVL